MKKRSELSRDELMAMIRADTSEAAAQNLARALDGDEEVSLPADLMGRCFRLTKKQLVLFELGFVTSAGEELVVTSVKPGSRAEAAGLRVDDIVTELRYQDGKSQVPVELVVKRKDREKELRLRFLPTGRPKPGRVFERLPGIADERC